LEEKMVLITGELEPRMVWRSRGNELTSDSVALKDWANTRVGTQNGLEERRE